jgi:hypothetical protein
MDADAAAATESDMLAPLPPDTSISGGSAHAAKSSTMDMDGPTTSSIPMHATDDDLLLPATDGGSMLFLNTLHSTQSSCEHAAKTHTDERG